MKLKELLRVSIGTSVTIEDEEAWRTNSAETFLRNLGEKAKSKEVKKVWVEYGCLQVLISGRLDELEEKQNGTQKSRTEN